MTQGTTSKDFCFANPKVGARGGDPSCVGCGATLGLKLALEALDEAGIEQVIIVNPAGCKTMTIVHPFNPFTGNVSWINTGIASSDATARGVRSALEIFGAKKAAVLVYGGDGASFDIGFASLSAAMYKSADRIFKGVPIIHISYDNEAYTNTNDQDSPSTPIGSYTSLTPKGNREWPKDMLGIIAKHRIYSATAALKYVADFKRKVKRAIKYNFSHIWLQVPCNSTAWGFAPEDTIKMSELAVKTGIWALVEIDENGILTINKMVNEEFLPVAEYLKKQKRFKDISTETVKEIQEDIDKKWKILREYNGKKYV